METKKLLQEFFLLERSEKEPGKARKLKGTFQIANEVNQNGRIYPKQILEREINKFSKLIIIISLNMIILCSIKHYLC